MSSGDFPTYAELTQTQGWGAAPTAIASTRSVTDAGSRYTENAVLGSGGMGKVLLARDARIGRDVAIKVLHRATPNDEQRERFLREAQVQGQLEHPSIVPVYDIDRGTDGATFFTMRRVLGKTLHAILDELRTGTAKHTRRELLQAFATVCLTIDYAHSRGVVHRDLKPANIMLGDFGEVYVLDWGVARVIDPGQPEAPASRLSRPGATMGTLLYIAPEQVADPDVGPAADVFSLGAILFEILTLERLRRVDTVYDPVEARPSVRAPHLQIAPELEAICVTATELEATARFASARALQEAVARYLEGDRELAQRRSLAAAHASRARVALTGPAPKHDVAMLELSRALALDPRNHDHVAMMAEVLRAPLQSTPPEIQQKLDAAAQVYSRATGKYTVIAMLSWFLFLPLVLALGVRRLDYTLAIATPAMVAVVLCLIGLRRQTIRPAIQYATVFSIIIAMTMVSRIFGPLILMPTMLAAMSMVAQAHPDRGLRVFGLAAPVLAITIMIGLELADVIPTSYDFSAGFSIVPQMTGFPQGATLAFLATATIATTVIPSVFVARMRTELIESQRREMLQTWRIRRLGDSMLRASR